MSAVFTETLNLQDSTAQTKAEATLIHYDGQSVTVEAGGCKMSHTVSKTLNGIFSFIAITKEGEFTFSVEPNGALNNVIFRPKNARGEVKTWWRNATGKIGDL